MTVDDTGQLVHEAASWPKETFNRETRSDFAEFAVHFLSEKSTCPAIGDPLENSKRTPRPPENMPYMSVILSISHQVNSSIPCSGMGIPVT